MYTKVKMLFLQLLTSFSKSVHYEKLSFACLTVDKELGTGRGSYTVALLVSPLVSLTIAKFVGLSFVVALFSALYVHVYTCTFEYLVRILFHVDQLRKCYNCTEI